MYIHTWSKTILGLIRLVLDQQNTSETLDIEEIWFVNLIEYLATL